MKLNPWDARKEELEQTLMPWETPKQQPTDQIVDMEVPVDQRVPKSETTQDISEVQEPTPKDQTYLAIHHPSYIRVYRYRYLDDYITAVTNVIKKCLNTDRELVQQS